ncbi:UNVERIFIED_CONTAM: Cytochrome b5 reductase 4 [Gekko kuhli]
MFSKPEDLDNNSKELVPSYDWFQTDGTVTVVIYTKQKGISSELVTADLQEGRLRGEIVVNDYSYLLHFELSYAVQEDIVVQVAEKVGKVELILKKKDTLPWKKLGQPLQSHNSFVKRADRGLFFRKCKLLSKSSISHDTRLLCVMLPPGTHLQVPVGCHLYLKKTVTGTEIVKPYTPVTSSLVSKFKDPSHNDKTHIYFMIKIYPSGLLTPVLDCIRTGEYISVSNPEGIFIKPQVEDAEDLFLLAAGTGFTPMVKLLNHVLTSSSSFRTAKLMFFNKTEDDILWRSQLEQLAVNDTRFDVQFVLSEPNKGWTGKQGRISFPLVSQFVKRSIPKEPQTPPSCYVTETKDQVRHNGCLSAEQVSVTQCEGTCKTYSLYSAEANSMEHKCSCCREERTTKKAITLNCPDGTTLAHFYIHVESCRCLDTECNEAASSEQTSAKRRRRQLTRK